MLPILYRKRKPKSWLILLHTNLLSLDDHWCALRSARLADASLITCTSRFTLKPPHLKSPWYVANNSQVWLFGYSVLIDWSSRDKLCFPCHGHQSCWQAIPIGEGGTSWLLPYCKLWRRRLRRISKQMMRNQHGHFDSALEARGPYYFVKHWKGASFET